MNGLHLIADLHGCQCEPEFLLDADGLEAFTVASCSTHGLIVVGRFFHQFCTDNGEQAGVTGTVVLAESHLALHTWPEVGGVTLDLYVCNFSADNSGIARAVFEEIIGAFKPRHAETQAVARGLIRSAR